MTQERPILFSGPMPGAKTHTLADASQNFATARSTPKTILDTRRRCPACKVRYVLPELRRWTDEMCWTCAVELRDKITKNKFSDELNEI